MSAILYGDSTRDILDTKSILISQTLRLLQTRHVNRSIEVALALSRQYCTLEALPNQGKKQRQKQRMPLEFPVWEKVAY